MVRINVTEGPSRDGGQLFSWGSGVLISTGGDAGWVVTCQHVICNARGPITVIFPNGLKAVAAIGKSDKDLDLAWLKIKSPGVKAITVAAAGPQINEQIWIAGYGSGRFIYQVGRLAKYLGSRVGGNNLMQITGAQARQGDSGGPILNAHGELVGILSAAGEGFTVGVRTGPLRRFLGFRPRVIIKPIRKMPTDVLADVKRCLADIQKQLNELKSRQPATGPVGPAGPKGADGTAGSDGKDGIATSKASHMVIVADFTASTWPRLKSEIKQAKAGYHLLRVSGLPPYSVGVIPQMVEYQDGSPVRTIKGLRAVSEQLALMARGEYPTTKKE